MSNVAMSDELKELLKIRDDYISQMREIEWNLMFLNKNIFEKLTPFLKEYFSNLQKEYGYFRYNVTGYGSVIVYDIIDWDYDKICEDIHANYNVLVNENESPSYGVMFELK